MALAELAATASVAEAMAVVVVAAAATVWEDLAVEVLAAAAPLSVELALEALAAGHSLVELAAAAIDLAQVAPLEIRQTKYTSIN